MLDFVIKMDDIESVNGNAEEFSHLCPQVPAEPSPQVQPVGSASLNAVDTPTGYFYAKNRTQREPIYHAGKEDAILSGVQ